MHHEHASEGHARLAALGLSFAKIAEAIGVAPSSVQRWFSSGKTPGEGHRLKIAAVFGIAPALWERPANARPATEAAAAIFAERAESLAAAEASTTALPTAVEQLELLIEQCRSARAGDVAPSVLARLAALEIRALAERERIRSAAEKAVRSPEAAAWVRGLYDTIAAHPLAVIDACRATLAASQPERLADWDRRYAAWRERNAALVDAAEEANAALRAVLPPGASFEAAPRATADTSPAHRDQ